MDFLDPKKQKAHRIRLAIGYTLMIVALMLATTVLLYRAYGFGLDKDGRVIQNGLVFISSQPAGADVYVNGKLYSDPTDTRLILPGGQYTFELRRDGYRTWKRAITVEGGSVGRFDYPVLFPSKLHTAVTKQYSAAPLLSSQSPDHRWVIIQHAQPDQFEIYDLDADKPVGRAVTVPAESLAAGTTRAWTAVEWADDNRHVVFKRTYQKNGQTSQEYILFDRQNPSGSRSLTELFGFTPSSLELNNRKFDSYYLYDQNSSQLFTANLDESTPKVYASDVLAFASDDRSVLFVTDRDAPDGKVLLRIKRGSQSYTVRQLAAQDRYVLEAAHYKKVTYIAAGALSENRVYVYKDPIGSLADDPKAVVVPVQILKVEAPNYVAFSPNARFVLAENGDRFASYDAETDKGYGYQLKLPVDAPAEHAGWMDGYHVQLISGGQLVSFDFDGANRQTLVPAAPQYLPFFNRTYSVLYALTAQSALTSTPLTTPEDQ